jgi:flavin-dependent dehydrogenase
MRVRKIAIVGGGPAGAFVAAELARAGKEVLLFDEKLAWEKPCGGGVTDKALARWPFLREAAVERNWVSHCELTAPSGRKASFQLDRQIAIFSRLALNGLMLQRARDAGAQIIRERMVEIGGGAGGWLLKSKSSAHHAEFVVVSAGARNPFRKQFAGEIQPEDFIVAAGYYIPGTHHTVQVKFLPGLQGYLWVFPRADHFSVGICGNMQHGSTALLRKTLEQCLPEFGLKRDGAQFYAHIIPSYTVSTLRTARFCGEGWAMAGDAAGFVDAITGEGIYYALQSAELLSQALLKDVPESYAATIRRELLPELEHAARIADRFYGGEWLGGPVIERMIRLTGRSPRFRDLMRDLFAGSQGYGDLKQRVRRSLPRIAAEALVSALWKSDHEPLADRQDQLAGAGNRT